MTLVWAAGSTSCSLRSLRTALEGRRGKSAWRIVYPTYHCSLYVGDRARSNRNTGRELRALNRFLHAGFLRSLDEFPGRVALEVAGATWTYQELSHHAGVIAACLDRHDAGGPPLTAVFGYRSATAFAGILAVLLRGHGYVPLNPTFPPERTARMLRRSGCRAVVVDDGAVDQLGPVLAASEQVRVVVVPDRADVEDLRRRYPGIEVLGSDDLHEPQDFVPVEPAADAIAYLLFTSGSTGHPKGVGVTHGNVCSFVDWAASHYEVRCEDRFSQTFDHTFDLSVFDMFVAWERGACVCCLPRKALLSPGRFIREREITVWFSVPSTAMIMDRLGALKPNRYPSLRWSLFCGEPLPVELAAGWQRAAPGSILENLYGPTEATIACTVYRWDDSRSPAEAAHGVVPIGEPIGAMRARVVNEDLEEVAVGEPGELLVSGPQVTPGYWRDPERTAESFVQPPGCVDVHYRTGDRVQRADAGSPLVYLGRTDQQIQVLGHRVELGEVEAVLREESGEAAVVALGWPCTASGASGVVAFIGAANADRGAILERVADRLPQYMVPRAIHLRERLPLNANGKLDRKRLLRELEEEA